MDKFDTSEYKVTYILGAGASAKALPTIKENSYGLPGFADALDLFADALSIAKKIKDTHKPFVEKLIERVKDVAAGTRKFGTPDTYAKYLHLKKKTAELLSLKEVLAIYFLLEQLISNQLDDRVLIFLTTVMEIGHVFPNNIKIISWNYDIQFQLTAHEFARESFDIHNTHWEKTAPLIEYYPHLGVHSSHDTPDKYSLVHLNGIAGYYSKPGLALNPFHDKSDYDVNEILADIVSLEFGLKNLITFGWEVKNVEDNKAVQIAKKIVEGTDIVVIIGYSFPFFNRRVDSAIFDALKGSGKLKKIIFQDPYRTGEFLRKQFNLPPEIVIGHVAEADNYLVPPEL